MEECDCTMNFDEMADAEILKQRDSDHLGSGRDTEEDD